MEVTGKKNLGLMKRALLSHLVDCSLKAFRSSEQKANEIYDPEIKDTQEMLNVININLERAEHDEVTGEG